MEGAFAADLQILNTNRTSGVVTRKSMFTKKPAVLGIKTACLALPQAGDMVGMVCGLPCLFDKDGVVL